MGVPLGTQIPSLCLAVYFLPPSRNLLVIGAKQSPITGVWETLNYTVPEGGLTLTNASTFQCQAALSSQF